ncbi:unnamed protein product [Rotaria sordida]|uniref:Ig-like domain-containing protein n=3 Tax=Rotaria sordida TaxID=392033 RepID=A0A813UAT3_9BILA|nr:unnamed protein product [Rotaria sordida]CAF0820782.1 unnamed protein product [Rotaria sordida]
MYTIEYSKRFIFILILFLIQINMILTDNQEDNNRLETIYRSEHNHVSLTCDLMDVAWWKRPNLLATRYGIILPKYRSKMTLDKVDDGTTTSGIQLHILNIRHLQSDDSGIYECETLGAIRQFNLTVTVRLTTVELGAQLLSSYDSTISHTSNQTDKNLLHQSSSPTHILLNTLSSNNEHIRLRENQLIRLTCVVIRALPAAYIHFPFDIEYRIEKNSTILNDDKTYRTILVLILRINRYFHKRIFHCEATQSELINDENQQQQQRQQQQHRILSKKLHMDVLYGPTCTHKIQYVPQFFTGIHRSINLTCFMNDANPSKLNFTWLLPNGRTHLGYYLNTTSNYITFLPDHSEDFGQVICRAQNELGLFGECHINLIMGGIPDPIESCHYTYANATLTVNCVAGFHQGDEDFFCYMFKRQDNGSFSEHARLKGNCAFILPELKPERHHDFRVFTKNKFGDNFDRSYSITVGKAKAESLVEKTRFYLPYMAICIIGACLISLLIICCCCHQIRRYMYKRKTKGNFDSLTYQNHSSHSYANSNGKPPLVHLKQNGNGTAYPVRPYRSKDYLVGTDSSSSHRNNPPVRSIYSTEDELTSSRKNILKETDLDQLLGSPNMSGSSATATIKSLPLTRNRPLFSAFNNSQQHDDELNPYPLTVQRRSSFQAATKLNSFDFYKTQEPFYLIDRHTMKMNQRNNYSPERDLRERENYREKRREYSPNLKDEHSMNINRQHLLDRTLSRDNSFIVENHMLTKTTTISATPITKTITDQTSITSSNNDQQWREMNVVDEIDYHDRYNDINDNEQQNFKDRNDDDDDNNHFDINDDYRDRISIDYRRDDDTTFVNYDRDEDRYRDDGIFV